MRDVSTRGEKKSLFLARATSLSLSLSLDQKCFSFLFLLLSSHFAGNDEKVIKSFENFEIFGGSVRAVISVIERVNKKTPKRTWTVWKRRHLEHRTKRCTRALNIYN